MEINLTRPHTPLISITQNATLPCIHLSSNSTSGLLLPFSFLLLTPFCPKDFGYGTSVDGKRISLKPHPLQRTLPPPGGTRIRSSTTIRSLLMPQKFPSLTVLSCKVYYSHMSCVVGKVLAFSKLVSM